MNSWVITRDLWYAGNYWARWTILTLVLWPILITITALTGWQFAIATVALLPLLAIVFGIIAALDPLVIAAIGTSASGRKILMSLAMIIGVELAVGVFFSAVPVANDRGLIPLALLTMVAIVFFMLSGMKGKLVTVLVAVLVGIAAVMFMGGREEIVKKANASVSAKAADYPICADTEEGATLTVEKPTAELPLDKSCWSGWVSLPDNYDFKADNGKGGELKVMLFNGKLRSTRGDGKGGKLWDGNIGTSSFRLLGNGVAKITATPKASGPALKPAVS